ncbi:VgrG protein [Rubellimicrobium mesophilum DSM 19309]|uniref:VgrG protein n=1 Tax=Rubellimicrobium mesophilum DSM 19309 TaxID=442562 RepID=A0A017HSZ5_9RHOB|nr:type VI secretion system tip protein VgrG [Rubellimicrobium mesophilum]EYD77450.1 VgrG protein [Rubellimicrobium mesophilum DSM 19309]
MTDREIILKSPLDADRLLFAALDGQDEISRCFAFELEMVSPDPEIEASELLGKPVTISIGRDEAPKRHLNGIVSDFGFVSLAEGFARYRATIRPTLWLSSLSTGNRIFQNKSVVQIVEDVLKDYPQVKFEKRLRKSYPPREYCVQYGESDLDFVQRLLEHEGILYFFEHSEGDHLLVLADESGRLEPAEGLDTLRWQPDERANFQDGDFIVQWTATAAVRTRYYAHTDYDFEKPSANLFTKATAPTSMGNDKTEAYHYPGNYLEFGRGDSLSSVRLQEIQAPRQTAEARATAPGLYAGATFTLTDFPREAENDAYLILRTRYRMWDGQYRTGMRQAGMSRADVGCEIAVDLQPASLPFRPARRTPRPLMKGPQTAVVVGPAGEEIFTDKYSRVKVQFHWDRLGKKDENSSCFVRVSSVWAGSGWGFIQIPRIGQEVIVDFLEGDPDQPIITGRVYNAEQMPPYGLPANATQSGWKSNSSLGGGGWNELRFEDKKGSEEVYFQAEKDHNELIKNDESRNIGHDWKEDVGHDATQAVGHDRAESVGNDKSTKVGRHRTVDIGANDTEHVHANRSLTVDIDETIHVVGNSTENIDKLHTQIVGMAQTVLVKAARSDTVALEEARVVGMDQTNAIGVSRSVTVGTSQSHSIGTDDSTTVGGGQTFQVGKDHASAIGGNQNLNVAGDQATQVDGGRMVKVGKDQGHDVTGNIAVKSGKKIVIEATDEITLKCGDATLVMKKDGTISTKGKDITLDGSGKITGKAGGDMVLKASKINQN